MVASAGASHNRHVPRWPNRNYGRSLRKLKAALVEMPSFVVIGMEQAKIGRVARKELEVFPVGNMHIEKAHVIPRRKELGVSNKRGRVVRVAKFHKSRRCPRNGAFGGCGIAYTLPRGIESVGESDAWG